MERLSVTPAPSEVTSDSMVLVTWRGSFMAALPRIPGMAFPGLYPFAVAPGSPAVAKPVGVLDNGQMNKAPSIFVSHGSPMMGLEDSSARRFLAGLGAELGKPKAILVASAHWETERLALSTNGRPETIHDFYGFPPALYESRYDAPGAPDAARRAAGLIAGAGMTAVLDAARGLDHGAWVPLQLMYPEADVPIAQISLESHLGPGRQLAVGRALAPLRDEGVMIVGSGNITHNLSALERGAPDAPPPDWAADFADWVFDAVSAHRVGDLVDYRRLAPHGERNHPSEDHFLPLLTALGAGGPEGRGRRLHASYTYAVLAMDAYAFG